MIAERLLEHRGHAVVIVTYADENVALECNDCGEVVYDEMYANKEPQSLVDSIVATMKDGNKYVVCVECKDTMIPFDQHGVDGWICDPCEEATVGEIL
jgi:uncharacterized Zn finger protein